MIEISHKYTCDYCKKSSEENNIVHIRATKQEMYDEGPIDTGELSSTCVRYVVDVIL